MTSSKISDNKVKLCKQEIKDLEVSGMNLTKVNSTGNETEILASTNNPNRMGTATFGNLPDSDER